MGKRPRSAPQSQQQPMSPLPEMGAVSPYQNPQLPAAPTWIGPYPLANLLSNEGGAALLRAWHGSDPTSPRAYLANRLRTIGAAGTPETNQGALDFLGMALNGTRLPPIEKTYLHGSQYNPTNNLISINPSNSDVNISPYQTIRHEFEHSRQGADVMGQYGRRTAGISPATEAGPSLGDIIHMGYAASRSNPSVGQIPIPLSPSYSPNLSTLMSQAAKYGYPARPMDELLSTPEGQQWLGQRMGEYGGVR